MNGDNLELMTAVMAIVMISLIYFGVPLWIFSGLILLGAWALGVSWVVFNSLVVILALVSIPIIRKYIISLPVFKLIKAFNILPKISQTERTAIDAGTVWVDAELFSGKPNFKTLMSQPYPGLTPEEQAFLEGPCETLCQMVNDWEVYQNQGFSKEVWDYMSQEKFFGLIIPKAYGGLEFSASANSAVVAKLSSRSAPLGITVMVPNSLGPAELLTHYGTEDQKKHYLPRLATAEEIPCFALTEPLAGSDAGAMTSQGTIFRGEDGRPWIRLSWKKRYITLASISTVVGLAFKLHDPDTILGQGTDLGITCALVPSNTPGVVLGRRHNPLNVPFYNCPTEGTNVEISIDAVIGGQDGVGKGWRMLMECLSAGRGISLPANCSGGSKQLLRVTSAYAAVRKQFGLPIGKFEGIQEKLAEIAGITYLLEATRRYTCGGLDSGAKPAVVTAIAKYNFTELYRKIINHGMDIQAGAAISLGPRNLLAHAYFAVPISITVEGANILTRTLMIFGQGAIRCHPYVLDQINAIETNNLSLFNRAFWGHIGHVIQNIVRLIWISITRGRLIRTPGGPLRRYYQKLSWSSVQFAVFSDIAMATLGGNLKRKEQLTGRFADVLSWMYIATSVLRRFEHEERPQDTRQFAEWSLQYAFANIQEASDRIFQNMGVIPYLYRYWSRFNPIGQPPNDTLTQALAEKVQQPGEVRDSLIQGIYSASNPDDYQTQLEAAFNAVKETEAYSQKIKQAIRQGRLKKSDPERLIQSAVAAHILTQEEANQLLKAETLQREAIQVDDFPQEEYHSCQKRTTVQSSP
jgi:acyl-CoA dehydrogenase